MKSYNHNTRKNQCNNHNKTKKWMLKSLVRLSAPTVATCPAVII